MSSVPILLFGLLAGDPAAQIDFDTDVIPVLTKAGCNAGACHGAAIGRGGFKLSLWGSDPSVDYRAIVQELEGRRVNLSAPAESLVLYKPSGFSAHGGGIRLPPESAGARRLEAWIRGGALRLKKRRLVRLDVQPKSWLAEGTGSQVPLHAVAHFDDGTKRDVTEWTLFTAADPAAVEVDGARATLLRRGQHVVVARYLDRVRPIQLLVPFSDRQVDLSRETTRNFIDESVLARLEKLRLPPSPPADDATFLRRLRLDLTGRLPTAADVTAFLGDKRDPREKRLGLVDRLLDSDDFTDYWTYKFASLLRIRSQPQDSQGALAFYRWLHGSIAAQTGYDEMARTLLTATGDSHKFGPANFYRSTAGPREQAEFVSQVFMAVRLRCANCHNHPLDRWKQDDYHGLAAIFARIERGRVIRVKSGGEVTNPRTGEAALLRIPGDRFLEDVKHPRQALADWLTARDNSYFARAVVNRLWQDMMGRGLIVPTDDLSETNPATHPQLLQKLAEDFVKHGYDLRHTLRLIAISATYGRSARTLPDNRSDDRFYSHALVRRLPAEVLADAIADVTGVPEKYGGQPLGTRAVTLFDSNIPSQSLDILGRCPRDGTCEGPAVQAGGLGTRLHILNGPLVNRKIADANGRLKKSLAAGKSNRQILEEFYLAALGRSPNEAEQTFWQRQFDSVAVGRARERLLEDFVWSLISAREFVTNH